MHAYSLVSHSGPAADDALARLRIIDGTTAVVYEMLTDWEEKGRRMDRYFGEVELKDGENAMRRGDLLLVWNQAGRYVALFRYEP